MLHAYQSVQLDRDILRDRVRAGRRSWGTIVYSRERTERARTIPSFRIKNERIERVLKILERFVKKRNENGTI